MRIVEEAGFRVADADLAQKVDDAGARGIALDILVDLKDLADLPLHRVQRIERGHRLLEHHGDVVAAHLSQVALIGIEQFLTLEAHRARRVGRRGIGQQLQDRQGRDRLARSRLADQCQRLALVDGEGHLVDCKRHTLALPEGDREILHLEKLATHAKVFRGSSESRTASPMKTRRDSMTDTTKKPVRPSQGA